MYDIHCHILPGLDDGSPSFGESLKMAIAAAESGTDGIICTPHVLSEMPYDTERIHSRREKLSAMASDAGLKLRLYSGQEIMVGDNYREIPSLLRSHNLLTLAHSGYVLIEFPLFTDCEIIKERTAYIASRGYIPIVAHPERYCSIDVRQIIELKESGALIQLNKGSLKGSFGEDARSNAHAFLENGLADFIASDSHSSKVRTPILVNAYNAVSRQYSDEYAARLMHINPVKILKNIKISTSLSKK